MGREQIRGRDQELAALRAESRHCAPSGRLVIVRGPAGIGKTRLMEAVARRRGSGERWTRMWVEGREATDRYGIDAVLDVLRKSFDRFGGSDLIDRIDHLTRLRSRTEGASAPSSVVGAELSRIFGGLAPSMVLVDDVLEIVDPTPLLLAARRPGCLVVASVTDTAPTPVSAELTALADEVIELGPLGDDEIAEVLGEESHEDIQRALRGALGPLYGNPGTVLATMAALREAGRLVSVDGRVRLVDPATPIPLPEGHALLRRTRAQGRVASVMVTAAATLGALDVDELPRIADALREDLAECGRTVDRLVDRGVLTEDDRGRLTCLCPALGTWAASEQTTAVRRLREMTDTTVTDRVLVSAPVAPPVPRERPTLVKPAWSSDDARIVDLISMGFTNRRIASELGVREKTVEAHLTRLFAKTKCRSRVELVAASMQGRLRGAGVAGTPGPGASTWSGAFAQRRGRKPYRDSVGQSGR